MGILTWIVLGLVVGILAKMIMPGDDPGGFFITILIGIAGALLGGFLSTALDYGPVTGFNLPSVVIAVIGSLILLFLFRMLKR